MRKQKQRQRIGLIADLHSGHRAGLTHPDYQDRVGKWGESQADAWDNLNEIIEKIGELYALIVDGDVIDGRGQASGGTELITSCLKTQCEMGARAILQFGCKNIVMARGTDYHTGWGGEDWEDSCADMLRAEGCKVTIKDHPFPRFGGVVFDVKHHVGSSAVPHTEATPILREKLQNEQWYLDGESQPEADVIIRAHVHRHSGHWGYRGDRKWVAIRLPALQTAGTKFGGRRCSSVVQWGACSVDVEDGKIADCASYVAPVIGNRIEVIDL